MCPHFTVLTLECCQHIWNTKISVNDVWPRLCPIFQITSASVVCGSWYIPFQKCRRPYLFIEHIGVARCGASVQQNDHVHLASYGWKWHFWRNCHLCMMLVCKTFLLLSSHTVIVRAHRCSDFVDGNLRVLIIHNHDIIIELIISGKTRFWGTAKPVHIGRIDDISRISADYLIMKYSHYCWFNSALAVYPNILEVGNI